MSVTPVNAPSGTASGWWSLIGIAENPTRWDNEHGDRTTKTARDSGRWNHHARARTGLLERLVAKAPTAAFVTLEE